MQMPAKDAALAHAQKIAPLARHPVEHERPEPDAGRLRHPHALVLGNRLHGDLRQGEDMGAAGHVFIEARRRCAF